MTIAMLVQVAAQNKAVAGANSHRGLQRVEDTGFVACVSALVEQFPLPVCFGQASYCAAQPGIEGMSFKAYPGITCEKAIEKWHETQPGLLLSGLRS